MKSLVSLIHQAIDRRRALASVTNALRLVNGAGDATLARLKTHEAALLRFARLANVTPGTCDTKGALQVISGEATFILPISEVIDLSAERSRLLKAIEKAEKDVSSIEGRLNNAAFVAKAKPEVVEESRATLVSLAEQIDKLNAAFTSLG